MAQPRPSHDVIHVTLLLLLGAAATLAACAADGTDEPDPASPGAGRAGDVSAEALATTRLDLSLDRTAITTELGTSNLVTVTLTGSGGFGGPATLSGSLVGPSGGAPVGWSIALSPATVTVPVNGTATAIATITIPSENRGLAATAKISVASSAATGTFSGTASVTALNQLTFPIGISGGLCVYPAPSPGTVNASIGTKLRWLNRPTNTTFLTIHVDSNPFGVLHQAPSPGSAPGAAYEQTLTGTPGGSFHWYCHSPGPAVNNVIQVVN